VRREATNEQERFEPWKTSQASRPPVRIRSRAVRREATNEQERFEARKTSEHVSLRFESGPAQ
jgi:hypothetical protein